MEKGEIDSPVKGSDRRELLSGRTIGLIISTGILVCVLAIQSPHSFITKDAMFFISRQIGLAALVALSQAVCLTVGGMNLSVGGIGSITTVVLGLSLQNWGLPPSLAVPIALGVGVAAGALNGIIITKLKVDSFIVTLSMMFVYMGLRSGISGGSPYEVSESFGLIGRGNVFGISYVFLVVAAVLIGAGYMYRCTMFGRRMLATGGNADAARLSGINTAKTVFRANMLSGFFASLAAVLYASRNLSAAPETGDAWLIISFAVAIIGGTSLKGGAVSALGIFMGATIFTLIEHGLVQFKQVPPEFMRSFLGGLILLAVMVDRIREIVTEKRKTKARPRPGAQERPMRR